MSLNRETIADWEEVAASLGDTPKFDEEGQVIPIGKPEEFKPRYYVVWRGRAVGIFLNWGLAQAMTAEVEGALFKKYSTLADARRGWEQGPQARRTQLSFNPGTPRSPANEEGSASRDGSPVRESWRFEVNNRPAIVRVQMPGIPAPTSHAAAPDDDDGDDDAKYWAHVPDFAEDAPPPSPSLSAISSISSLTATSITTGTVSPRTVRTPQLSSPDNTPAGSPVSRGRDLPAAPPPPAARTPTRSTSMSRTISCRIKTSSEPRPIKISTLLKADKGSHDSQPTTVPPIKTSRSDQDPLGRMPPSTPIKTSPSASKKRAVGVFPELPRPTPSAATTALPTKGKGVAASSSPTRLSPTRQASEPFQPSPVEVQPEKEAFVVVRGDRPGIYFDRTTALLMLGTRPGMKLVRFRSIKKASWYFVQEYMAGRVGVPVVVVADD
ncbi:hypothetical protein ACG7TL_000512 [Trametes sanguinea]